MTVNFEFVLYYSNNSVPLFEYFPQIIFEQIFEFQNIRIHHFLKYEYYSLFVYVQNSLFVATLLFIYLIMFFPRSHGNNRDQIENYFLQLDDELERKRKLRQEQDERMTKLLQEEVSELFSTKVANLLPIYLI